MVRHPQHLCDGQDWGKTCELFVMAAWRLRKMGSF